MSAAIMLRNVTVIALALLALSLLTAIPSTSAAQREAERSAALAPGLCLALGNGIPKLTLCVK
jgi:hypothetical protein